MLLPRARTRRTVLIAIVVAALAGCGDDAESAAFESVAAATLSPGDPLPPASNPILTIDGLAGETIALDIDTIEAVGLFETTIREPFLLEDLTFEGVWLCDLLDVVGGGNATSITMHALDDYMVAFELDELDDDDAFLATRSVGEPIPIEDGGPIRLLFLDPDGIGSNADLWIWNIDAFTLG